MKTIYQGKMLVASRCLVEKEAYRVFNEVVSRTSRKMVKYDSHFVMKLIIFSLAHRNLSLSYLIKGGHESIAFLDLKSQ